MSIYIYIYIYIYIKNKTFISNIYMYMYVYRLLQSGDSQGQETFIVTSAEKQTRNYETEC